MGYITETFVTVVAGVVIATINKGSVNLSVIGLTAGSGTVLLQRKSKAGTWATVRTMVVDTEEVITNGAEGQPFRFNCTVRASGTFVCELGD